ncbi:UDP-glucose 4-epimerase GalE [Vallicoccus soli]|uniref:UDP-glucose 4-epimerase n=1 Tax=Vallicoccus soli TaxID=2339232 RepID=A0A3A3YSC1_9ACTN|nr:UDP-glucose 4-epimerase GalE [Vallicoccus soli]RJK94310.1 UDP-glucose 4-epimerase GalE [Vallicoccus soli]
MTWLLTGGAGYIGAHVAHALRAAGEDVVALDDLSSGVPERLPEGVPLVRASVLDTDAVRAAFREHGVTGVVHLAAKKAVGESVAEPLLYWRENVGGLESLLRVVDEEGVRDVLFSSSAAVYGTPDSDVIVEDGPTAPINPYGETKLVGEWMLRDLATARGTRWTSLRYFNVAGAGSPQLGDTAVANLIPMVFRALDRGEAPKVFGDDYPTPDGSCVRDYIHVADLADAHVVAAQRLRDGGPSAVYNVARGEGASVKEVLAVVREVTGLDVEPEIAPRRPGDPARLVASPAAIERDLGWRAQHDLRAMVASAWEAWTAAR